MRAEFLPYLAVMALTTYLIRMLPLTFFRRTIHSRLLKNFFYYIPFAVLAAMTFPDIIFSAGTIPAAIAGLVVAVVLTVCKRSLIVVSLGACAAAFLAGLIF